jgi:hypothetical protein
MRQLLTFLFCAALITGCGKSWTPPRNPNPQSILSDAEADAKAGKYADALAKQVWFYKNALKYDSGEYGVRLSFALSDWIELGKVYPPALEKLKAFRDEAEKNVRDDKKVRDNFSDFESINEYLKEEAKTVDLFVWIDSNKPDSAKAVFDLARPALVKSKQYTLLGKYIQNPFSLYDNAVQDYERNVELAKDPKFGRQVQDFGESKFKNETTTLIALLVVTDQKAVAEKIAEDLKKQPYLPKDNEQIQKALNGEVPPPWP